MKETKLADKRQWKTEEESRKAARTFFKYKHVSIVHSPHKVNKLGDYWVEETEFATFVRSWEEIIFTGLGAKA